MLAQHRQQSLLHRRDVWLTLTGNIPIAAIEQNTREFLTRTQESTDGACFQGLWNNGGVAHGQEGRQFKQGGGCY